MLFKDWEIEPDHKIPDHPNKTYYVANHIRALLDLLELGNFTVAQGMKDDFICTDEYDEILFKKLSQMTVLPN